MKEYVGKNSLQKLVEIIVDALPSKELTEEETQELWDSVSEG
jgi:hypothetical protein